MSRILLIIRDEKGRDVRVTYDPKYFKTFPVKYDDKVVYAEVK